MPYVNSASWETIYDANRKQRVTRYSYGNITLSLYKAVTLSSSINPHSCSSNISRDIYQLSSYQYNEIPITEYTSSYKQTPFVRQSFYTRKLSSWGNLAFRHMDKQRGYSRIVRNGPRDYLDEKYVSSSIPLFENTYHLNYDASIGPDSIYINKFFVEEIGNDFNSWGSGSLSSSCENFWDNCKFNGKSTYKNTKEKLQIKYTDPQSTKNFLQLNAIYGDGFDNINSYDLFYKMAFYDSTKRSDKVNLGLLINENWESGTYTYSPNNTTESMVRCIGYVQEGGLQSQSYLPNDYIEHPCPASGTNNRCQIWRVSGRSGSFELKINNEDIGHNETVQSNVGIISSYYDGDSQTQYKADWGSINDPTAYAGASRFVNQFSCSLIVNSLDTPMSASSLFSYNEIIFSINYPLVNENFESENYIGKTQGFTIGEFVSRYDSAKVTYYQIPLINFDVDGKIKIITCDNNYKPHFSDIGLTWQNDEIYKVCYFFSVNKTSETDNKNQYLELMINDKFIGKYPLNNIMAALYVMYEIGSGIQPASYYTELILADSWIWFGSIHASELNQYKIYCIRRTKYSFNLGATKTTYPEGCANWSINRVPLIDRHYNLKKKYGTTNFGMRRHYMKNNNEALVVSCSELAENNLNLRNPTYNVEKLCKLFKNNPLKDWYVNVYYYPAEGGW